MPFHAGTKYFLSSKDNDSTGFRPKMPQLKAEKPVWLRYDAQTEASW
jgi:hypothetical protein